MRPVQVDEEERAGAGLRRFVVDVRVVRGGDGAFVGRLDGEVALLLQEGHRCSVLGQSFRAALHGARLSVLQCFVVVVVVVVAGPWCHRRVS